MDDVVDTSRTSENARSHVQSFSERLGLAATVKAGATWGLTTIVANALVLLFLFLALRDAQHPITTPAGVKSYFFTSGSAGSTALGLIAGALVDLGIRSRRQSRARFWIGIAAVLGTVVACSIYPDVIAGGASEPAADKVAGFLIAVAIIVGAAAGVLAAQPARSGSATG